MSTVTPTSIPITSGFVQFVIGLNASTKPYLNCKLDYLIFFICTHINYLLSYLDHACAVWFTRIFFKTAMVSCGRKGIDPAAAHGTIDPSIRPINGGPPHAS